MRRYLMSDGSGSVINDQREVVSDKCEIKNY